MKYLGILTIVVLIATSGVATADTVTFEATVNSPRVFLDEAMQLTLTFTGVSDNLNPVSLPVIDGFTTKYLGPSSSTSFVFINGKSESNSSQSFIYNLFPNKVGKFQVPAISATIAGQTYTTQPIDVEVLQNSSQAPAPNGTSGQDQAPSLDSIKDKILLIASADKKDVYLNQRVPLTIKLFINDVPIRDIQYPQFDKTGVLVDDFEKPVQSSGVINGVRYDTLEFKTYIYPDHLGDLTIGPVQLQGNIVYKTGQSNPLGQDNGFLGSDVFSNLFDSYATRPITITSQPVVLHVSAISNENRPDDFSGAIGQSLDFQASVSPSQVKAGDPLTLKMQIEGSGNFKSFKMPEFQAIGFKTYAPQIKDTGDKKTAEEVIIPTSASITQVPALRFSYFDTSANDYKTITQGPFKIQVTAPSADQEFKAVGFTDLNKGPLTVPANQSIFGKVFKKAGEILSKLIRSIWFWVCVALILTAGISYYFWRRFQNKLENDPAFARRFIAVRQARQALVSAKGYITAGQTKDLYALLSKVLRDYLANKWHLSSAALSNGVILGRLKTVNIDETHIAQLKTLLDQADLVCFAGTERSSTNMQSDLALTENLLTYLQQHLK